jgi:hypothetical protein
MVSIEALYDRPVTGEGEVMRSETATIAVALRRPELWPKIRHLQASWFDDWGDQILWQALVYTLDENDGLGEFIVFEDWLQTNYPDEAEGLLARISQHSCEYLWPGFVEHDARIIERNGLRKSVARKLDDAARLCRERAPMSEVRRVLSDVCRDLHLTGGAV